MCKIIKLISLIPLFITPQVFADREAAAMHAQDMAEAMQRQADALDEAAWNKRMNDINGNHTQEVWAAEDAADAAQQAADSAQAMANELSGY